MGRVDAGGHVVVLDVDHRVAAHGCHGWVRQGRVEARLLPVGRGLLLVLAVADRALKQGEDVLVATKKVAGDEDIVDLVHGLACSRLRGHVLQHLGHGGALADAHRTDLDAPGTADDVDRGVTDGAGEQVLEDVSRLDATEFDVGILVVPHERRAALLDKGPGRPLAEVLEDQLHAVLPLALADRHIQEVLPFLGLWRADDGAVLGGQPDVVQVGKRVGHSLLLAAAEDDNVDVWVLGEGLEAGVRGHVEGGHRLDLVEVLLGQPRGLDGRGQRRVVSQDQQVPLAGPVGVHGQVEVQCGRNVLCPELGLDVRVVELGQKRVRPRLGRVDGHVHVVLPVPLPPLLVVHRQRVLDGLRQIDDVPRVDQEGAGTQTLRRAGKLREDQHAGVVALARHVLVRDQVHTVSKRGDQRDVRDGV